MRRILILIAIYLISFSVNLSANSNLSVELGKNYLTAVLNSSYKEIPQYINMKKFTKQPELTLWEALENIKNDKSRSPEEIAEIQEEYIDPLESPEENEAYLKEKTIGEFITFFLMEAYQGQAFEFHGPTTSLSIVHVGTITDSDSTQHHIFNVSQTIAPYDNPSELIHLHDSKLITVKNMEVVIPARIEYLIKLNSSDIANTSIN